MSDKIKYPLLGLIIGSLIWAGNYMNKNIVNSYIKELVKSECLK